METDITVIYDSNVIYKQSVVTKCNKVETDITVIYDSNVSHSKLLDIWSIIKSKI